MTPIEFRAGDVGFTAGTDWIDRFIREEQARRYGHSAPESRFNHCFMVVDDQGGLMEARARGMVRSSFQERGYSQTDYSLVRPAFQTQDQQRAAVAEIVAMEGQAYGYLELVSLFLALRTGTRLRFGVQGDYICSGAVSRALEVGGILMGDDAEWNMPADVLHIALIEDWDVVSQSSPPGLAGR